MMPQEMLDMDPWQKGTRRRVKEWVKDNVGRRGEDPVAETDKEEGQQKITAWMSRPGMRRLHKGEKTGVG